MLSVTSDDLDKSWQDLEALEEAVASEETPMAGGRKQGFGAEALAELRTSKVSFGDILNVFRQVTPADFEKLNLRIDTNALADIESRFDYYYFVLPVSLQPKPGAQFTELECQLTFAPETARPIVQSIAPESEWNEVLQWGGEMSLNIDTSLSLGLGLPANMPSNIKVPNLASQGVANAMIAINRYRFGLGRANITATGYGNNYCFWRISKPELQTMSTVSFAVLFKLPKGTQQIQIRGIVAAYPSFSWLTQHIRHVLAELGERWRSLFQKSDDDRSNRERLPIGDHEIWDVTLPG
jgi:hypothetical protein